MRNPVVHVERRSEIISVGIRGRLTGADSPDSVKITVVEDQEKLILIL